MAEQHGKTLVPQIRFAGFTDPWEQRKLGEVASGFEYGLNAAASDFDGEKKYLRITDIDDQTREFRTDDLSSPDINNPIDDRYLLKEGDILFARTGASVGKTYLYKASDGKTYYAGFLIRAHVSDEADAGFIFQSTLTERYKQFVLLTSQRSGQPGINAQEYSDLLLPLPSLMEQRRIGAFFDRLDSLITLHQRKYDKLCVLKKSMLDKMFPKGGSLYPEIRFAGFTDPWEQRKLGDILQERNVRTSDFESNPIFSLTIEDGITPKTDRYERTSLITKTEDLFKIVSPNEFVTNPMNLRFGAFGYNKNSLSVCVSGYYDVFSIDNDKCSGFWNSYFKTPVALKRFDDAATGSLIEKRRVKYSTLCQLIFLMPKGMGEKKQIGAFFDRLDSLITLHQRKLELLRNIKKSMLDKMFV